MLSLKTLDTNKQYAHCKNAKSWHSHKYYCHPQLLPKRIFNLNILLKHILYSSASMRRNNSLPPSYKHFQTSFHKFSSYCPFQTVLVDTQGNFVAARENFRHSISRERANESTRLGPTATPKGINAASAERKGGRGEPGGQFMHRNTAPGQSIERPGQ